MKIIFKTKFLNFCNHQFYLPEAKSKEKHDVRDPMPELTTYNLNVHSRVDFNIGNPKPESTLALCQSRLYTPVRDFGFGLRGPYKF
jgi:hypothetical protein